ncbi:MAG: zinc metalloprotease HtpX [Gemmatimonadetes bacterium]|nr:zinc metalloprotease HtpX [Gemmatimonadota bacterium]
MNMLKTFLLMVVLTVALVFLGGFVGGQTGALIALILAGGMNFVSYFFSDRIVLKMYRAREVGREEAPELYDIVEHLSRRAGLPMPRVAILPQDQPNAFATGRNPEHAVVAATQGILKTLDRDELEGVMAHELAHVKHRDILISSVAATLAGAIMYVSRFGLFFGGNRNRGGGGILTLVVVLLAPIAAMFVKSAISRSREFAADQGGAEISGKPRALASALRKLEAVSKQVPMEGNPATSHMFIVHPFRGGGAVLRLFSTHPATDARVERLMGMRGFG